MSYFIQAAITKHNRLSDFKNRTFFFPPHSSGGWKVYHQDTGKVGFVLRPCNYPLTVCSHDLSVLRVVW